jgi:hypothetical protein
MSIKKVDDVKHQMIVAFKFALVVNRCINLGFSLKKVLLCTMDWNSHIKSYQSYLKIERGLSKHDKIILSILTVCVYFCVKTKLRFRLLRLKKR